MATLPSANPIVKALGFATVLLGSLVVAHSMRSQPVEPQAKPDKPASQAVPDQGQRMKDVLDEIAREPAVPIMPDTSGLNLLDNASKEKFFRSMGAYYDYRAEGYRHRLDVFRWQFLSSKIIFIVVIFLVLVGVYFSWVQFRSSQRMGVPVADATSAASGASLAVPAVEVTEIVASIGEVRVKSPVVGVVLLVISLLFFYLYLVYVYPIHSTL